MRPSRFLLLGVLLLLSCVTARQEPAPPPLYYYAGPHLYPAVYGGDWCAVYRPHAHDFYPDQPEYYAYADGYYFWVGRPAEASVDRNAPPPGVVIHVEVPGAPHAPAVLPPQAPPPPSFAGAVPTRDTHPAPSAPPPPSFTPAPPPRPVPPPPAARRDPPPPATPPHAQPPPPAPGPKDPPPPNKPPKPKKNPFKR